MNAERAERAKRKLSAVAKERERRDVRYLQEASDVELDILIAYLRAGQEELAAWFQGRLRRRAQLGGPRRGLRRAGALQRRFFRLNPPAAEPEPEPQPEPEIVPPTFEDDGDLAPVVPLDVHRERRTALDAWLDLTPRERVSARAWRSKASGRNESMTTVHDLFESN